MTSDALDTIVFYSWCHGRVVQLLADVGVGRALIHSSGSGVGSSGVMDTRRNGMTAASVVAVAPVALTPIVHRLGCGFKERGGLCASRKGS